MRIRNKQKEAGYIIKVVKSSQGEPVNEDEGEGEPKPEPQREENRRKMIITTHRQQTSWQGYSIH